MRARLDRARTLVGAIFTEFRAENVTFMAGSIAYHAFVSLLPLLVLLLTVASLVGNATIEDAVFSVARAMLSQRAGDALVTELQSSTRSASLSVIGAVVLLWGTLRIFRGLDTAFSDIYETEGENSFLDQLLDGFVVLVAVAFAIVLAGTFQDPVATGVGWADWVLGGAAATAGIALAFFPMYYVFPDADVTVREVVPGTVFAAVGLATFESLFGLYLEFSSRSPESSIVAGVLVLLTWLYFSGLFVLFGVVINAVLANRSRDIDVVPVFGEAESRQHGGPAPATREELAATVDRVEQLLESHDEVVLAADGEEVTVLAPTHVIADTGSSSFLSRGRPVGLELQWTPARRSGEGEERSGTATDPGAGTEDWTGATADPDAEASAED